MTVLLKINSVVSDRCVCIVHLIALKKKPGEEQCEL